jgi:hypothetical protein
MKYVLEHWWNDTDKGKPKNLEKNLSQFHFANRKSHMDWPGIKSFPPPSVVYKYVY